MKQRSLRDFQLACSSSDTRHSSTYRGKKQLTMQASQPVTRLRSPSWTWLRTPTIPVYLCPVDPSNAIVNRLVMGT